MRLTQKAGDARQIAREFDAAMFDGLCLIGGDGTIHETVSGLLERDDLVAISLGVIPGGTGNDVAQQLDLRSPQDAARKIIAGQTRPFDVARVKANGQIDYSVTLVGWAGVADINCNAERLRRLGPSRYPLAAFWQILFPRRRTARLVLDDTELADDFALVAVCNTIFTGHAMRLAPHAKVDDGKPDVVILRNASRRNSRHPCRFG